jgi:hypothetical protein
MLNSILNQNADNGEGELSSPVLSSLSNSGDLHPYDCQLGIGKAIADKRVKCQLSKNDASSIKKFL